MEYYLVNLTGPEQEPVVAGDSLTEAHETVRSLWDRKYKEILHLDPDADSRLAWRSGDKVYTYTYDGEDVLVLIPTHYVFGPMGRGGL